MMYFLFISFVFILIFCNFYKFPNGNKKFITTLIWTVFILSWFPYLFDRFVIGKFYTNMDISHWSSFLGSYIGATITLGGVAFQIHQDSIVRKIEENNNQKEKELEIEKKKKEKKEGLVHYLEYIVKYNLQAMSFIKNSDLMFSYDTFLYYKEEYPRLKTLDSNFLETNYNNFFLLKCSQETINFFDNSTEINSYINNLINNFDKKINCIKKLQDIDCLKNDIDTLNQLDLLTQYMTPFLTSKYPSPYELDPNFGEFLDDSLKKMVYIKDLQYILSIKDIINSKDLSSKYLLTKEVFKLLKYSSRTILIKMIPKIPFQQLELRTTFSSIVYSEMALDNKISDLIISSDELIIKLNNEIK